MALCFSSEGSRGREGNVWKLTKAAGPPSLP
jgi:hypothetical protein